MSSLRPTTRKRGAVRPQARAPGARQQDDVAGAEAHERLAFAADMGQHELAALALAPGQHGGRSPGSISSGCSTSSAMKCRSLSSLALSREVAEHVGHAVVGVAHRHAPGRLQAPAEFRIVQPALAAEQPEPEAEVARPQVGEPLGDHPLQHRRIGGRAGDGGDPQLPDGADQQLGVADPEGHDGGARRLQRRMVGVAAHPQPIVEAMDDAMAGPEPARRLGPGADDRGLLRIARRQRQVHRRPARAGGAVDARDPVLRRRQIVPERRMRPLALPQHLLVDERQLRQPLQPPRRLRPRPDPPMQRRAGGHILPLPLPCRLPVRG